MNGTEFIRGILADRIVGLNYGNDGEGYKFAAIKRAKAEVRLQHPDIELIDLGVGEPDEMADGSVRFSNAEQFCDCLLRQKLISAVPWDDAGSFVRFSATFAADTPEEEFRLIGELKRRLAEMKLVFA